MTSRTRLAPRSGNRRLGAPRDFARPRPGLAALAGCLLVALLCPLLARPVLAEEEFPPDPVFRQIEAHRDAYDRVLFFFGDSISMICLLSDTDLGGIQGDISDPAFLVSAMATLMRMANTPGKRAEDPLWPMHSPASAVNFLLAASGRLVTPDGGQTISRADLVATYAGSLGLPVTKLVAHQARHLADLIDRRVIRDGDVVVFEDAGFHGQDPDTYAANWTSLAITVLSRVDVTLVFLDTYDTIPEVEVMGLSPNAFRFEAPYPSPATGGSRSHNQAIRDAFATVAARTDLRGRPVFCNLRQGMEAFATALDRTFGTLPMTQEGVHPNILGEGFLVRQLLRCAGLAPLVTETGAYLDLFVRNADRLCLHPKKPMPPGALRAFLRDWLVP